jgi:hypothetical protein
MMMSNLLKAKSDDQEKKRNEKSYIRKELKMYCCVSRGVDLARPLSLPPNYLPEAQAAGARRIGMVASLLQRL